MVYTSSKEKNKRVLLWSSVSTVSVLGLWALCSRFRYCQGYHIGVINACYTRGLIWKTPEIEFLRTRLGTESSGGVLRLSLRGNSTREQEGQLVKDCHIHSQGRTQVKLYYDGYLAYLPWKGDTRYYLRKVEVL